MLEKILSLFFPSAIAMPHGYCLSWQSELVLLHAIANALIALAYLAIPATIYIFIRQKQQNLAYKNLFWLFAAFIAACALTHIMEIVVIWRPYYLLQGLIMAITAIISIVAAIVLGRQMPALLKLPTVAQLQTMNEELAQQIIHKALLEQKLRLTQFSIDNAGEGIYWINPDASILYANQAASNMLGYELAEFLTLKISDINPQHSAQAWLDHWQKLKKYKTLSFEASLWKKDRSVAWFEITANFIEYEGKEYNCAFVRNISEQVATKNALLESRNILQTVLEAIPIRVFWKDCDSRYLGCNTLFAHDAGKDTPQQLTGLSDQDLSWHEQAALYQADDQEVIQTKRAKISFEEPQNTPDGKTIWLRTSKVPLYDANQQIIGLLGIYEDISLQKLAENALKTSEFMLKQAQEIAHVGHWILDLTIDTLYWSDEIYRIFGVQPQEFGASYQAFLNYVHPDDRVFVDQTYSAHLKSQTEYNIVHRLLLSDGSVKYVNEKCKTTFDAQGEPLQSMGVVLDITERQQAEQQISDLLDLNQKIISQSPVGVKVFNASGQCVACNSAAAQTLNKTIAEVLMENFYNLNFWKSSHLFDTARLCLQQKTPQRLEIQTTLASGKKVWLDYNFATFNSNHETHLLVLIHDVTEYRQTETALRAAELTAVRANQAKSEFIANMSHEIRTPMNAILGFSAILADLISNPTQQYYLSAIKRSGKTLLQLINDILDLSKIEAGKFNLQYTPVVVKALLDDIVIIFSQKAIDKSIELLVEIAPELPPCLRLDEIRLRQILLNLVGNAVKFTEQGFVKIIVNMEPTADPGQINLMIEVCDSGVGIPEDQQEKIFAAFTQQDHQNARYGGTGLGLTICKRLLELMGGRISVDSKPGKGSCFILNLDAVEIVEPISQPLPAPAAPAALKIIHFQPSRILLVDDIPLNRLLIKSYLAEFRELTITEAETGEQALALLAQQCFDLILMDRRLPGDDGDAICRKIRAEPASAKIPIIMITASVLTVAEQYYPPAFDVQLEKPLNKDKLLTTMQFFLPFETEQPELEPSLTLPPVVDTEQTIEMPQLLALLKTQYLPMLGRWHDSGVLDVDEMIEVGERLKTYAEKHHCLALKQWSQQLITEAELFDLTNLPNTIKSFKELLGHLE